MTTLNHPGEVQAAVTYTLKLTHGAQHGADLTLGLVTKMRVGDLGQVASDLTFEPVGHLLHLPHPLDLFLKCRIISLIVQLPDKAEHLAHPVGEESGLLLCLKNRDFRGLHDTGLDILEAELLIGVLLRNNVGHHFLKLRDKPDQDSGVGHIEHCVEGRQHK